VSLGWIHRTTIQNRGVTQLGQCRYVEVNDEGLVIERDDKGNGKQRQTLSVDTVVICAGQEPERSLQDKLLELMNSPVATASPPSVPRLRHIFSIGGSLEASELDAKRAIDQGTRFLLLFSPLLPPSLSCPHLLSSAMWRLV
jgi:2,4-dienoyl-CoA reductase (NADPH2)